jgi:hypothetical protein
MGDPLDAVVGVGDRRPLGADAEVDPAAAMRLAWVAGSVRDNRGHRHEEAAALLAEGHRQHPGPPLCEQPYKPPSVLLTAELADDGEGEVTPVGFQPQRAAVEPDPATVAVAGLEPREPDRRTRSPALLGRGPGMEGGYQICDPAGVGVLGAGRPPWGDLALTLVPGLAERRQRPGQGRHRGIGCPGVQVGLDLGQGPVVGEPASTEMLLDQRPLHRRGCLHLEPPTLRDPAVGDHEPPDSRHLQ